MLWEFLQQHKDVASVYFVSGWDKKKQRHIISLIRDDEVPGPWPRRKFLILGSVTFATIFIAYLQV